MEISNMKIIANKYNDNEVFKILREWTGLTQEELAKELGYKSYHTIKQIERGVNAFSYHNLMKICKKHGYTITIEKK